MSPDSPVVEYCIVFVYFREIFKGFKGLFILTVTVEDGENSRRLFTSQIRALTFPCINTSLPGLPAPPSNVNRPSTKTQSDTVHGEESIFYNSDKIVKPVHTV